jgi:hypothetical protein
MTAGDGLFPVILVSPADEPVSFLMLEPCDVLGD